MPKGVYDRTLTPQRSFPTYEALIKELGEDNGLNYLIQKDVIEMHLMLVKLVW
jgi:hypothetical protein